MSSSSPAAFQKLGSSTLRSRIADEIRQAILTGTLREGTRLVERKLAAEFGASLTAVREAIVQLEAEGFITKRPNSTTHVTSLGRAETGKIFQVRRLLETFAAETAAKNATAKELANLEHLYGELLQTAQSGDGAGYISQDFEWHCAVWACSGNEYLENALRRVVVPLFALSAVHVRGRSKVELLRDAHSHFAILEALRTHDPEGARLALEQALAAWERSTEHYIFDPPGTTAPDLDSAHGS
jgi:DNA-binding GntR family transcriptional regulator